ncbi:uncharacterized protein ARMOST_21505 [Armillaria ostoyae]|uniref:Uncharacterized protein n=1 Tax=Armillaria ostoyae TaxID=47428 RepID=A0A284SAE0_ARMOS|nr:uncharacterized protein ARMOST_21505 [Armillaria ostoyae]
MIPRCGGRSTDKFLPPEKCCARWKEAFSQILISGKCGPVDKTLSQPPTNFSFFLTRTVNRSHSTEVMLLKWTVERIDRDTGPKPMKWSVVQPRTSQARILDVVINWAESTRQACSQNHVDNSIVRCGILPYGIERWTEQTSVLGGAGDHHRT